MTGALAALTVFVLTSLVYWLNTRTKNQLRKKFGKPPKYGNDPRDLYD